MAEKFTVHNDWLKDRPTILRIIVHGEPHRLLVSRGRGWEPLLSIAGEVLARDPSEDLCHFLAVLLLIESQRHGEARLDRLVMQLTTDPSQLTDRVTDVAPRIGYESRRLLTATNSPWRFPLLRALDAYAPAPQCSDELAWLSYSEWLTAAERAASRKATDLGDLGALLLKLIPESGFMREVAHLPAPDLIAGLAEEYPNFTPVTEYYASQIAIALLGNRRVRLPPVLLIGNPGVGKTAFATQLAKSLGVGFRSVSFSHASQGGSLGGVSSFWSTGRQGWVFDALHRGGEINPVFVLDEIDKVSDEMRYNPLGPLYSLLEQESAQVFQDEFAELPIDASWITWIATANEIANIPTPIQSRLIVFEIRSPTCAELRVIASHLYQSLVASYGLEAHLPSAPPEPLLEAAAQNPREMRLLVQTTIGKMARAKLSGRDPMAMPCPASKQLTRRMGFL